MISICIPAYNSATTILESLISAANQDYEDKEILIIDQESTDGTGLICQRFSDSRRDVKVRYILSSKKGIGTNLVECMDRARGELIIYLCSDDVFADAQVVGDYVRAFKSMPHVGVIGHYFYQFMDGHKGAIMVSRDKNIITSSCNPSGMAFRKDTYQPSNKIFVEMPLIVAQAIKKWEWSFLEYDTIAVRIHKENTAVRGWYYTESPIQNWFDLTGRFDFFPMFIQLKNRSPQMLWSEICLCVKLNNKCLWSLSFWACAIISLAVPSKVLRIVSDFYRHRISRMFCKIKRRDDV